MCRDAPRQRPPKRKSSPATGIGARCHIDHGCLDRHHHGHERRPDHAPAVRAASIRRRDDPLDGTAQDVARGENHAAVNSESGLKGISGVSSDIHDIGQRRRGPSLRPARLPQAYCSGTQNIGAYVAAMGGIDVLGLHRRCRRNQRRCAAWPARASNSWASARRKRTATSAASTLRGHFNDRRFAGHHPGRRQRR